jgi:hypothetical protein|tara:strand:+ start:548 stop:865 length:318 start_codon:yes stop_codon:yes gene_type:complete
MMTTEIDNEVTAVLASVSTLQNQSHTNTGKCYKEVNATTNVDRLTYSILNYWNDLQGYGYGVIFEYVDDSDVTHEKSIDIGFLDPDIIIEGYHPVAQFDWRESVS